MKNVNSATVLGALVADSAALGLHWLYDPARIAEIEASQRPGFLQPEANNYAGVKGLLRASPEGGRRVYQLWRDLFVDAEASGKARQLQSSSSIRPNTARTSGPAANSSVISIPPPA